VGVEASVVQENESSGQAAIPSSLLSRDMFSVRRDSSCLADVGFIRPSRHLTNITTADDITLSPVTLPPNSQLLLLAHNSH